MEFVITNPKPIRYREATVRFDGYEEYKAQAQAIAEYINHIELTEDNIKEVKQDLADARKVVDGLNEKRKEIKRNISGQLKTFEDQIKELGSIIDLADQKVRDQVREIEERERDEKKKQVIELFNKRLPQYTISKYDSVYEELLDRFWNPSYANKSTSIKKIEDSIVEFLESTEKDLEAIDNTEHADELLMEYLLSFDLRYAMMKVNKRYQVKRNVNESDTEMRQIFVVIGKANIIAARTLLEKNGIKFIED